jgi:hypothetical protein
MHPLTGRGVKDHRAEHAPAAVSELPVIGPSRVESHGDSVSSADISTEGQ